MFTMPRRVTPKSYFRILLPELKHRSNKRFTVGWSITCTSPDWTAHWHESQSTSGLEQPAATLGIQRASRRHGSDPHGIPCGGEEWGLGGGTGGPPPTGVNIFLCTIRVTKRGSCSCRGSVLWSSTYPNTVASLSGGDRF